MIVNRRCADCEGDDCHPSATDYAAAHTMYEHRHDASEGCSPSHQESACKPTTSRPCMPGEGRTVRRAANSTLRISPCIRFSISGLLISNASNSLRCATKPSTSKLSPEIAIYVNPSKHRRGFTHKKKKNDGQSFFSIKKHPRITAKVFSECKETMPLHREK